MPRSYQARTREMLADPRRAACTATLIAGARRGEFVETFADMFQPNDGITRDKLLEVGRAVETAMQRKSYAARARALGRLGVKLVKRYVDPEDWTFERREGESAIAAVAHTLFEIAEDCRDFDWHSFEPKYSLAFGYCIGAARVYRDHGVTPTPEMIVRMAHAAMQDHHCGLSVTDVDNEFRDGVRGLPLRVWLEALNGEAPTDSEGGP